MNTPKFYILKGLRLAFIDITDSIERQETVRCLFNSQEKRAHDAYVYGLEGAISLIKSKMHSMEEDIAQNEESVEGWQPIETAPKDGSNIMLYYPLEGLDKSWERIVFCYWSERENNWVWSGRACRTFSRGFQPTHWMPLPEPPNERVLTDADRANIRWNLNWGRDEQG
jgi:uncharacterized protein DUF551